MECLTTPKRWSCIHIRSVSTHNIIRWTRNSRNSKFKKQVIYAGLTAMINCVWKGRNSCYWMQCIPDISYAVNQVRE